ncbi:MAG: hypothetical protein ACLR4A_03555 [Christensenellales bacterium]
MLPGETAGIGSKAAEEMPQLILDAQSVDVVTSATASYTKDAIQKAAQDCVNQALIIKPEAAQAGLQFETNEFGNPLWLTKDLGMFKWREKPAEPTEFVATGERRRDRHRRRSFRHLCSPPRGGAGQQRDRH